MPLYYIHFGFIINRLLSYTGSCEYSIVALNCLKIIFELRSDESTLTYIDKIKNRKYELLVSLLENTGELLAKEFNQLTWNSVI